MKFNLFSPSQPQQQSSHPARPFDPPQNIANTTPDAPTQAMASGARRPLNRIFFGVTRPTADKKATPLAGHNEPQRMAIPAQTRTSATGPAQGEANLTRGQMQLGEPAAAMPQPQANRRRVQFQRDDLLTQVREIPRVGDVSSQKAARAARQTSDAEARKKVKAKKEEEKATGRANAAEGGGCPVTPPTTKEPISFASRPGHQKYVITLAKWVNLAPTPAQKVERENLQYQIHEWLTTPDEKRKALNLMSLSHESMPPLPDIKAGPHVHYEVIFAI